MNQEMQNGYLVLAEISGYTSPVAGVELPHTREMIRKEIEMSEPIIFISNQKVKEGKLEGYKRYYRQVAEQAKANKPGTVAHVAYVKEDGSEVSIIHIFPDAKSMEVHMQGVDKLAKKAYEFIDVISFEIYGEPSDTVLGMMVQIVGSGVTLSLKPHWMGGYIRFE